MEPISQSQFDTLAKELRRMRLVFGFSIAAIAIMLMVVLPSVIQNSVFRVNNEPETKGLLSSIVEFMRGEPIVPSDAETYEGSVILDETGSGELP